MPADPWSLACPPQRTIAAANLAPSKLVRLPARTVALPSSCRWPHRPVARPPLPVLARLGIVGVEPCGVPHPHRLALHADTRESAAAGYVGAMAVPASPRVLCTPIALSPLSADPRRDAAPSRLPAFCHILAMRANLGRTRQMSSSQPCFSSAISRMPSIHRRHPLALRVILLARESLGSHPAVDDVWRTSWRHGLRYHPHRSHLGR